MTQIAINVALVLVLLGIYFLRKNGAWKKVVIVLLFLHANYLLFLSGDSLRTQADLARSQGHSFEFIEGLARMNKSMMPTKINIAIVLLGLLVVGLGSKRK